ncbi:hypothetical protein [Arthrobacter sp. AZCC_0090]|uniref:hypothetical protein n=1 Tax=Arthrobacter sp. AZCC_0090 TaxID=2735881 RepID=UPI0016211908|nr:hypothetical protein [Arthrobacter sp. AZCC_0090]MBB6407168.1 hypothetical protein [Arthrobacter sp. AZCC_0090]
MFFRAPNSRRTTEQVSGRLLMRGIPELNPKARVTSVWARQNCTLVRQEQFEERGMAEIVRPGGNPAFWLVSLILQSRRAPPAT